LELLDELQKTLKKFLNEIEELSLDVIESDLRERFDNVLVVLKSSARA